MRASDLAGPSSFPTTEPVTFGETLNRLPDLAKWKHALSKKMTGKEISLNLKLSRSNQLLAADQGTEVEHVDNDDDLKDGNMESQKRSKKRKQQSILDRLNVDDTVSGVAYSDDFLSHSTLAMHNPLTQYLKGKSSSKNQAIQKSKTQVSNDSQSQNVAKAFELGKIREQSRLAYQQLKAKRKLVDR